MYFHENLQSKPSIDTHKPTVECRNFSQENKYSWPRKHDLSWSSPWWSVYGKEDHRVKRDKIAMVKKISCFSAIDYRVVAYCLVFVFVEENLDIYKSEFYTIS